MKKMGVVRCRHLSATAMGAAVALGVTGCVQSADYDFVQTCVRKHDLVRVDERYCVSPANRGESEAHGWYFQQFPPRGTEVDDNGYDSTSIVVVDVGQRSAGGTYYPPPRYSSGGARVMPSGSIPSIKAPGTSGISRGGLGVSSGSSSSGGSKGGSSGS